jgi:hypothetical protein
MWTFIKWVLFIILLPAAVIHLLSFVLSLLGYLPGVSWHNFVLGLSCIYLAYRMTKLQ